LIVGEFLGHNVDPAVIGVLGVGGWVCVTGHLRLPTRLSV
jgi:hypothetical protein